jgi:hypothetical protein
MEVGDYGFAPKTMSHFSLSRSDANLQGHGIGPEDQGRVVTTTPPICFVLKIGTQVHGSYGDGVVVGAQCTPGELTQYRVEKQDGVRFWAQRDELKVP